MANYHYLQTFFIIFFVTALGLRVSAQPGFRGSAVIGLTASQIDGDKLVGFRKLGLTTGLKVAFDISPKVEASVELLYSQRGSRSKVFGTSNDLQETKINYFELPVYLSYRDWHIEKENYHKMLAHFGFSLANSLNVSTTEVDYDVDNFAKRDFSWFIGATYYFSPRYGLTARYTRSINKLLKDDNLLLGHLLGYFWSIRAEYNF